MFTIQSSSEETYAIIDEFGRTIQQVYLNSANNFAVNIENLNSGIYYIIGNNNNETTTQKITILK